MKIVTIIGARPQFIKAAPFSHEFRKNNQEVLVHTGQHYDANMSSIFFDELNIPLPDYNLNVGSSSHGKQTAMMLEKIESILIDEKPDGVLVYGDTNSTLAGALAGSKLHIPIFHVEAGLRSYNKHMPEEQNRIVTDHLSTLLFCPTETSVNNLSHEGITKHVYNVGDIMFDAVVQYVGLAKQRHEKNWVELIKNNQSEFPEDFNAETEFYLATIHRAENTDEKEKLCEIFKSFGMLDRIVLLPLHPRTKKYIHEYALPLKNVIIINPVSYLLMLMLISKAKMVITDSGGLQKEAFFLKKQCVTLRSETEWVETLKDDWNVLSEIDAVTISRNVMRPIRITTEVNNNVFGDGNTAFQIVEILLRYNFEKNGRTT